MKILTSNDLKKEFLRLLSEYDEYYWSVAWAGIGSNAFDILKMNRQKIKKIIIGLHFYQTHPTFIQEFINEKSVKYIFETEGTYHPKLYLFKKDPQWELIIGSPNFTQSAFTKNREISMLISSKDEDSKKILSDVEGFINTAWNDGILFDEIELTKYRNNWSIQHKKIRHLSGKYGTDENPSKAIFQTNTLSLTWSDYLETIKKEKKHGYKKRILVLKIVRDLFNGTPVYKNMNLDERKFIAGIYNDLDTEYKNEQIWKFFGNMSPSPQIKEKIKINDENISLALDQIPLTGQITKQDYLNFWGYYGKSFNETAIATATRLLAMKRPDYFICLDNKNKDNLCKDFEIKKSVGKVFYWDEIIERILDSTWWQTQEPNLQNEEDRAIFNARAAFLDSIFYEE